MTHEPAESFFFKRFSLQHRRSTLKIGTDSVLLAAVARVESVSSVLDIGCGCGVITFCIADRINDTDTPHCHLTGIDIDVPSIEEANLNLNTFPHRTSQTIDFINISLQKYAKSANRLFNLIVANPPFFNQDLKPDNARKQQGKHRDGQLPFEDLVAGVDSLLQASGLFYLILPPAENEEFKKKAISRLFLQEDWHVFPRAGKPMHRVISVYTRLDTEYLGHKELYIRDFDGKYTSEYKQLTENLYL
ncbi:MAG: methyltransferase [Bacteroidales bacterium]|jgi:tRNA1Val (adenine37-N6)-methyltransferase|nr:methyltransferase [Bacteroidales bacterium]